MNRLLARRAAAVILTACAVAACGTEPSSPGGSGTPALSASALSSGVDAGVLDPWATFPVTQRPRPIVLLDQVPHGSGSDPAKLAVLSGNLVLATTPPAAAADALVRLPDGPARLKLVSAQQALSAASRDPRSAVESTKAVPITQAVLGTETFSTDRGRIALPAWVFTVAGGPGKIAWPALEESAFWRPKAPSLAAGPPTSRTATVSGRDVTVSFDTPPDPCPGEPTYRYDATSVSSATAVAVGLRAVPTGSRAPGKTGDCEGSALGSTTKYSLTLASPLGNRVLLGADAEPVPVTGA